MRMSVDLSLAGFNKSLRIISFSELNPIYCFEHESIKSVVDKIIEKGHRRLCVLAKNKKIIGIVTSMDILSAFLREQDFNNTISTIMNRDIILCNANDSIGEVLQKFKFSRRGGFPVLDGDKLVAMVSERDIVRKFAAVDFGIRIGDVMTKKPFCVKSNTSILDSLKIMANTRYRRLPIIDDKKLVGIITSADILSYLRQNNFSLSSLLQPIIPTFSREFYYIDKDKDLSEAIKTMVRFDVGGLPVVGEGIVLEGIVTERDILEEIV